MKIYTKKGDCGYSSLYDGKRIQKNNIIFDVLGEIDELTSRVGLLSCYVKNLLNNKIYDELYNIQGLLQFINSNIATIDEKKKEKIYKINDEDVYNIESLIDYMDNINGSLTKFILPGSTLESSYCHLCRTQTRKVERYLWNLENSNETVLYKQNSSELNLEDVHVDKNILKYMNRLSDYFFSLARYICTIQNIDDRYI